MITQILWFFTWPLLIIIANVLIKIALNRFEANSK